MNKLRMLRTYLREGVVTLLLVVADRLVRWQAGETIKKEYVCFAAPDCTS